MFSHNSANTDVQVCSLRRSELFTVNRQMAPLNCARMSEVCYRWLPCFDNKVGAILTLSVFRSVGQTRAPCQNGETYSQTIDAKDVLENIRLTQAAEGAEKCRFCPWWPCFDLYAWPSKLSERGTKHVLRVNLSQIRSAVHEILFHTKNWRRQKQNLPQFTACSKH